jgi:hypothetical protein
MRNLPRLIDDLQSLLPMTNPMHAWCLSTAREFIERIVAQADFCQTLLQLSQVVAQSENTSDSRRVTAFLEHHEEQIVLELEMLGIEFPVELRKPAEERIPSAEQIDIDIEHQRSEAEAAFEAEIADKERLIESNFARAYIDGTF